MNASEVKLGLHDVYVTIYHGLSSSVCGGRVPFYTALVLGF
jgi:hypothetical protein